MVGEFCDAAIGGADWCSLIDSCYASGWPLFGWAWNGDGGEMNMIEPHWDDQPLARSYNATDFMDVVTDKLIGIPCNYQADEGCESDLIGEECDDENDYTINDRYNENCACAGVFTSDLNSCLLYTSPSPRDQRGSRMPSSA